MGGNVYKNTHEVVRLDLSDFNKLQDIIVNTLKEKGITVYTIPFIRNKETFGDLDVIVTTDQSNLLYDWIKTNNYPYVTNGNVVSIYYEPFKFQIDFLLTHPHYLEYSKNYFSWGCAGNLIGRLSKKLGFKHGHRGLYYVQRVEDHVLEEISLSFDYLKILQILGLNEETYLKGFNTEEELFNWFTKSLYFNPEYFKFENLPNKDRVRDRKRKDYSNFIEWCETKSFSENLLINKEDQLQLVLQYFPEISDKININLEKFNLQQQLRNKFNGTVVSSLTGLKNKELGNFLSYFKSKFSDEWILETNIPILYRIIIQEHLSRLLKIFLDKKLDDHLIVEITEVIEKGLNAKSN